MQSEIEYGIIEIDKYITADNDLNWLNCMTIREMEKKMRQAAKVPFYYGFASFNYDDETVVFAAWPFYYKYSHKFRRRQMRHRIGRWVRNVIVPKLMR